jgi:hypothetical protein
MQEAGGAARTTVSQITAICAASAVSRSPALALQADIAP